MFKLHVGVIMHLDSTAFFIDPSARLNLIFLVQNYRNKRKIQDITYLFQLIASARFKIQLMTID